MNAQRWKRAVREVAAIVGGVRLPNNGSGQPDVRADGLAVQVKTRLELPGWLTAAVDQAKRDAKCDEVPIVVLVEVGQGRKARRLAMLDLDRFETLSYDSKAQGVRTCRYGLLSGSRTVDTDRGHR